MDFKEFRSSKVWLKVEWAPTIDENAPPDVEPPASFTVRVAYQPAALGDKDAVFLSQFDRMRLADFNADQSPVPPRLTGTQLRAQERAKERADATPPGQDEEQALGPLAVEFMERLIVDWDVMYGGEKLPLTRESFEMFELGFRREIVSKILVDYLDRPNRMSSLTRSLGGATASGQTGQPSAPTPSNGVQGNSPGTTPAAPDSEAPPSGSTG